MTGGFALSMETIFFLLSPLHSFHLQKILLISSSYLSKQSKQMRIQVVKRITNDYSENYRKGIVGDPFFFLIINQTTRENLLGTTVMPFATPF